MGGRTSMCWVSPSGRTSTSPPVRLKDICHVCEGWETTFCLQIFPPLETDQANKRPLTRLQERLIKKLGGKWTLCVDNLHAFRKTSKADRTICTLRTKHHVLVAFALSLTDNYDAKLVCHYGLFYIFMQITSWEMNFCRSCQLYKMIHR